WARHGAPAGALQSPTGVLVPQHGRSRSIACPEATRPGGTDELHGAILDLGLARGGEGARIHRVRAVGPDRQRGGHHSGPPRRILPPLPRSGKQGRIRGGQLSDGTGGRAPGECPCDQDDQQESIPLPLLYHLNTSSSNGRTRGVYDSCRAGRRREAVGPKGNRGVAVSSATSPRPLMCMVRPRGIEPLTFGFVVRRSIHLS